jgi:hypothetical protein
MMLRSVVLGFAATSQLIGLIIGAMAISHGETQLGVGFVTLATVGFVVKKIMMRREEG